MQLSLPLESTWVVHWKHSRYDVLVMRPGPWGNPFVIGEDGTRDEVCDRYEEWLLAQPALVERVRQELRGKVLGCCCRPRYNRCHADTLARIANS